MSIDISNLPPPPKAEPIDSTHPERRGSSWEAMVGNRQPMGYVEPPVDISALPPPPKATAEALPPPPDEKLKRYYELQSEKDNYGIGDLVTPGGIQSRGGVFASRGVPAADVDAMAAGRKLSQAQADLLHKVAPLYVAAPPLEEMTPRAFVDTILGRIGYWAADLPQFGAKKIAAKESPLIDEKFLDALDDLRELGEGRMGAAEWALWNFGPAIAAAPVKAAAKTAVKEVPKSLPRVAAVGALTGAAQGLGSSREGTELQSAATGAALGGAIGPAAAVAGKAGTSLKNIWHRLVGATEAAPPEMPRTKAEKEALEYAKNNEADITDATNKAAETIKQSEDAVEAAALRGQKLDEATARTIVDEQLSPDTVGMLTKKVAGEADDVAVAEAYVRERKQELAQRITDENPALKQELTADERALKPASTDAIIEAAKQRLGEEYITKRWKELSFERLAKQQVELQDLRVRGDEAPGAKIAVNGFGDRQFGIKVMDERTGIDALIPFLKLNALGSRMKFAVKKFYSGSIADGVVGVKTVFKEAKKAKALKEVINQDNGAFFDAMETRQTSSLPEPLRNLATNIESFFAGVRNHANTMTDEMATPLSIPLREDFVLPHMMVRPIEYATKMAAHLSEITKQGIDLASLSPDDLSELAKKNPLVDDFVRGVKIVSSGDVVTGKQLMSEYKAITGRGASSPRLHVVASTAMPRREAIPDFLREKNILRLMDRYMNGTFKAVYLREPLSELASKARILDKMGAKIEAEYLRRIISDKTGIRATSYARLGNVMKMKFVQGLDSALANKITDPAKRKIATDTIASLAEIASNLQYNIYTNVLGVSPRALLAQFNQVMFKTAPELGGKYGYESALKSYGNVMFNLSRNRTETVAKMRQYGLEPAQVNRESIDQLADAIQSTAIYRIPAQTLRTVSQYVMKAYQGLDTLNRAAMIDMAERLVRDAANNNKGAQAAISKMPVAVKRAVTQNAGKPEEQAKVIAWYLNSATQYNYNKESMSELGAIVGPFYSTFTKWPLATAGDFAAEYRTRGIVPATGRVFEKYAVTWLMAAAADSLLYYAVTGDKDMMPDWREAGPRWTKLIGAGGIKSTTPVESLRPLSPFKSSREKSLMSSPLVDSVVDGIIVPMLDDKDTEVQRGVSKAITTFGPGGFVGNLMLDTIPALLYDEPRKPMPGIED